MTEPVFELNDVHFAYLSKFLALGGISMTVHRGEKIVIIGANGTGKSTLLQLLDGLIFPDAGTINAFGKPLNEDSFLDADFSKDFRRRVGFVFQNPDVQLFCPTVREDIMFGPLQLKIAEKEIYERLGAIADNFGIGDLLERSPHQLSVGEKRKVAIASTLIMEPDVIILDEPTAGLDPLTSRHIVDIIIDASSKGRTIITATHDMHVVEEISDIVYVLGRDRRIARQAPAGEILADIKFLEDNNLVHIHRHRHDNKTHAHPHIHAHLDHHSGS